MKKNTINNVQCLLIADINNFCDEYCNIKGEATCDLFDDNGDEADGNCYMIPLIELPQTMDFKKFGKIVLAEKIDYDNENKPNEGFWIGWSSTNVGYVVL